MLWNGITSLLPTRSQKPVAPTQAKPQLIQPAGYVSPPQSAAVMPIYGTTQANRLDDPVRESNKRLQRMGQWAKELHTAVRTQGTLTETEYGRIDFNNSESIERYIQFVKSGYGGNQPNTAGNLPSVVENISKPAIADMKAFEKKESFSQPDMGQFQGYDIFMLILIFMFVIMIAIYFKVPAKIANVAFPLKKV
jgi:hypothetical protein